MSFHILIIFWGHSMKKTKKPWENQKNKRNQTKQYFQTLLGSLHEKTKENSRKQKKTKKTKKTIISDSWGGGALEIVSKYCFFFVFSRFFWFFHGVTPEESENIVFFGFFCFWFSQGFLGFFMEWPQKSLKIFFFCFFWFSQGFFGFFMEWPQKSLKICFFCFFGFSQGFFDFGSAVNCISMGPSPKCLKILYCYDYTRRRQKWNTKNMHFML